MALIKSFTKGNVQGSRKILSALFVDVYDRQGTILAGYNSLPRDQSRSRLPIYARHRALADATQNAFTTWVGAGLSRGQGGRDSVIESVGGHYERNDQGLPPDQRERLQLLHELCRPHSIR